MLKLLGLWVLGLLGFRGLGSRIWGLGPKAVEGSGTKAQIRGCAGLGVWGFSKPFIHCNAPKNTQKKP